MEKHGPGAVSYVAQFTIPPARRQQTKDAAGERLPVVFVVPHARSHATVAALQTMDLPCEVQIVAGTTRLCHRRAGPPATDAPPPVPGGLLPRHEGDDIGTQLRYVRKQTPHDKGLMVVVPLHMIMNRNDGRGGVVFGIESARACLEEAVHAVGPGTVLAVTAPLQELRTMADQMPTSPTQDGLCELRDLIMHMPGVRPILWHRASTEPFPESAYLHWVLDMIPAVPAAHTEVMDVRAEDGAQAVLHCDCRDGVTCLQQHGDYVQVKLQRHGPAVHFSIMWTTDETPPDVANPDEGTRRATRGTRASSWPTTSRAFHGSTRVSICVAKPLRSLTRKGFWPVNRQTRTRRTADLPWKPTSAHATQTVPSTYPAALRLHIS